MPQDPKSTVISDLINNRSRCQVQTRSALISCACGGGWVSVLHPWTWKQIQQARSDGNEGFDIERRKTLRWRPLLRWISVWDQQRERIVSELLMCTGWDRIMKKQEKDWQRSIWCQTDELTHGKDRWVNYVTFDPVFNTVNKQCS